MNKPLVSVIMPVFNGGRFVAAAIESILNQTYENWEFIIIDDRSTDATAKTLRRYLQKDKRIMVSRNRKRLYLSGSLNRALALAKGQYIARMDADDISLPERLGKQVQLLESDRKLVAVGGQEEIIDEFGKVLAEKFFPTDPKGCRRMFMNFMPIQPPVLMARAQVMQKLTYDTTVAKHDDIDMHAQLLSHGEFSNVPDIIFRYRYTPASYTFAHVKEIFFIALYVRLKAIARYGYRPHLLSVLVSLCQTLVVTLLPDAFLLFIFELIRYSPRRPLSFLQKLRWAFTVSQV